MEEVEETIRKELDALSDSDVLFFANTAVYGIQKLTLRINDAYSEIRNSHLQVLAWKHILYGVNRCQDKFLTQRFHQMLRIQGQMKGVMRDANSLILEQEMLDKLTEEQLIAHVRKAMAEFNFDAQPLYQTLKQATLVLHGLE